MSKHVFIIKEQLCESFWQLVKVFRFEAKKIEGGPVLEISRVNISCMDSLHVTSSKF